MNRTLGLGVADGEQLSREDTQVSDASVTLGGDFPVDPPIAPG